MTNLPITTSTPQTAAASSQSPGPAETADPQNGQPFGEVLARQINDPAAKDAKPNEKPVADALLLQGAATGINKKNTTEVTNGTTDARKSPPATAPDSTAALPTSMLAALMPQVMNGAAATGAKPEGTAGATQDKPGVTAMRDNIAANVRADTANAAATAIRTPQVNGQTFTAILSESAGRTAGATELNAGERAALGADAAPKPDAAAMASLQNNAATAAAPVVQPVQLTVNAPVAQDNKWSDEFSQKITWLASSTKDQTAELHLNPPQLGPLDVVIKVSGDQATALFTSPHAAVRDAVEQAMPKLRDMLAGNGIMLGNATVSDQTPRDQGQSGSQRPSASRIGDIRSIPSVSGNSTARVSPILRHNGIVDTFA